MSSLVGAIYRQFSQQAFDTRKSLHLSRHNADVSGRTIEENVLYTLVHLYASWGTLDRVALTLCS